MEREYIGINHAERRKFVKDAKIFINTYYGSSCRYISCFHNDNSNTFIAEGVEVMIDGSHQYEYMFDIKILK